MTAKIYLTVNDNGYMLHDRKQIGAREIDIGSHAGKPIFIGGDMEGYAYRQDIKRHLVDLGYFVTDIGPDKDEHTSLSTIAMNLGKLGYTGAIGIDICSSLSRLIVPKSNALQIYPATITSPFEAMISRRKDNSNVLGIPVEMITIDDCITAVNSWLTTPFFDDPKHDMSYLKGFIETMVENDVVQYRKRA